LPLEVCAASAAEAALRQVGEQRLSFSRRQITQDQTIELQI
jgi:hypothetical protein